ncbi:MAG: hypothetical protein DHS20C13_26580 [Thermodesulfobacteriota bacterium]|nr:MAG: hypothetical protein DHS20C13_26580 [Thermodesulfobacteriota bacterium]
MIEIDDKTRATSQYNYENSTYDINNPVAKYQKIIACDDYDDTDANQHMLGTLNGSKLVPGCKYYNKILDNPGTYYYCVSCNLTLSGEVKTQATAEGNENPIFIDTCTAITDCDGTSNYNKTGSSFNIVERVVGDTPLWNTYFSCYKCSNNKVPTLHVKIAANNMTGLEPYDPTFADGTNKFSGQTGGALVACRQLYNGDGSVRTDTPPDLTLQNIDANNKLF